MDRHQLDDQLKPRFDVDVDVVIVIVFRLAATTTPL
jgi:hypothetical protein